MQLFQQSKTHYLGAGCALLAFAVACCVRTLADNSSVTFQIIVSIATLLPLLHQAKPNSPGLLYQQGFIRIIIPLWILGGLVTAAAYLTVIHPVIGGVDWFYYLCYSRDSINFHDTADNMYSYFPGIYMFWMMAMRLVGTDLGSLQCLFATALAMNCLLVGVIVYQHTQSKLVAIASALWTLILLSRFDGVHGESEIIANLFFLAGIIAWRGLALNSWKRWKSLLLFGICLGLTVYLKQQAGLLALGALVLLGEQKKRKHRWDMLLSLPGIALVTLVLGVLTEGRGLEPISIGLSTASSYSSQNSWLMNLYTQLRHDESFWILATITTLLFVRSMNKNNPNQTAATSIRLVGFLILAGLATLIQFKIRPYHHYLLLTIPAVTISSSIIWHQHRHLLRTGGAQRLLMITLAILPFCWAEDYRWGYHPAQWPSAKQVEPLSAWHQREDIQRYIRQLAQQIPRETTLLVLPGRHNSIHYLLHSRSAAEQGYSFQEQAYQNPESWQAVLQATSAEYVLLLHPSVLDDTDQLLWNTVKIKRAMKILQQHGYDRIDTGEPLLLFQR